MCLGGGGAATTQKIQVYTGAQLGILEGKAPIHKKGTPTVLKEDKAFEYSFFRFIGKLFFRFIGILFFRFIGVGNTVGGILISLL